MDDIYKLSVNRESLKTAADVGRQGRNAKKAGDEKALASVKEAKRGMSLALRPVASAAQYPGRWGTAAASAGAGGYAADRSLRKNYSKEIDMGTSAFGVEHEVSKAFKLPILGKKKKLHAVQVANQMRRVNGVKLKKPSDG